MSKNIPVVLADRTVPESKTDFATANNFAAAYEITKYLIGKVHKWISIIVSALFSTERLLSAGYGKALYDQMLLI